MRDLNRGLVVWILGISFVYGVNSCTPGEYVADPADCGAFYECTTAKGVVRKSCPSGLQFNPTLEVCDWPQNVQCKVAVVKSSTYAVPDGCTAAAVDCNALWLDSASSITVHFRHDTECDRFCQCDLFGRVHDMPCAPGTAFNPSLEVCDWPHSVVCDGDGSGSSDETPGPPPPPESDESTGSGDCCTYAAVTCNALWLDSSSSITIHLKHDTACDRFCQCDLFGRVHDMPCAPGTLFNPVLQVCDWPHKVECDGDVGPGSEGSPEETSEAVQSSESNESTGSGDGCTNAAVTCNALWLDSSSSITVHLKHDSDCYKFCQCDLHGRVQEMRCAEGTHFNSILQVCVHLWDEGCI